MARCRNSFVRLRQLGHVSVRHGETSRSQMLQESARSVSKGPHVYKGSRGTAQRPRSSGMDFIPSIQFSVKLATSRSCADLVVQRPLVASPAGLNIA